MKDLEGRSFKCYPFISANDEGLMLKVSAFQIFHIGNSTLINSFNKTKFLFQGKCILFCYCYRLLFQPNTALLQSKPPTTFLTVNNDQGLNVIYSPGKNNENPAKLQISTLIITVTGLPIPNQLPEGGGTPIWIRWGCSSEILNLTPKGDHLGVTQAFCDF